MELLGHPAIQAFIMQGSQQQIRPGYSPAQPSGQSAGGRSEPPQPGASHAPGAGMQYGGMNSYGRPPPIASQSSGPPGPTQPRGQASVGYLVGFCS